MRLCFPWYFRSLAATLNFQQPSLGSPRISRMKLLVDCSWNSKMKSNVLCWEWRRFFRNERISWFIWSIIMIWFLDCCWNGRGIIRRKLKLSGNNWRREVMNMWRKFWGLISGGSFSLSRIVRRIRWVFKYLEKSINLTSFFPTDRRLQEAWKTIPSSGHQLHRQLENGYWRVESWNSLIIPKFGYWLFPASVESADLDSILS